MRRVLATVVLVLSAVVGLPSTARAGGPTSVLITHVGASAGALYYTDDEYDDLVALLPDVETQGRAEPPGGIDYNLTWMIHDVAAWRWDRVRVSRDGSAWVSTSFTNESTGGWEQVGSPARLATLLAAVQGRKVPYEAVLASDAEAASPPPATTATEPDIAWFALTGWRWVVPGGLLGLLVGAVAARRRRDEEPRRVLISSEA